MTDAPNPALGGRTVVLTRAADQADALRHDLEALGATVLEFPTIAIERLNVAIPDLSGYAWVGFTSVNGVRAMLDGLARAGRSGEELMGVRVAAIGPGTAAELAAAGIEVGLVPEHFVAESLLDAFPTPSEGDGNRILLAQAEAARDVLAVGLTARGFTVDVLVVYRSVVPPADPTTVQRMRSCAFDAITFTSSSTARNFVAMLGSVPVELSAAAVSGPVVVSIGPITSATARECGVRVDAEAREHSTTGVVAALLDRLHPPGPR